MNDSEYNGFGEEEITEFTPTEFSYGDSTPSTSSAVPEEIPVEVMFGDEKPKRRKTSEVSYEDKIPVEFKDDKDDDKDGEPKGKNAVVKEIMSWVRTIEIGVLVGVFLVVFVGRQLPSRLDIQLVGGVSDTLSTRFQAHFAEFFEDVDGLSRLCDRERL